AAAYERALALTADEPTTTLRGRAYLGLGMGRPERAIDCFERALSSFRQHEDRGREALALSSLALARAEQLGESGEAIRLLDQALAVNRPLRHARLARTGAHAT